MSFDGFAQRALDTAQARGSRYTDIRFEVARSERIEVRNGVVAALADGTSSGYGIRALVDGAWGFAAGSEMNDTAIDTVASRAVAMAKAAASIARTPLASAPSRAYVDTFVTPMLRDPAGVPLGERVALLLEAERLLHVGDEIAVGRAWLDLWRTDKYFFSSIARRAAASPPWRSATATRRPVRFQAITDST
jgi:TldD protein